jgi:glutamate synthase (NADPH/NADH) large chain
VLDTHYFAVLVGVGATCVNAYMAQETLADRHARGPVRRQAARQGRAELQEGDRGGLLKIMSKMGISVISSYRGGYNFEALGLSRALVAEYFPGMTSRISGIGLRACSARRRGACQRLAGTRIVLPVGGFYKARRIGRKARLGSAS